MDMNESNTFNADVFSALVTNRQAKRPEYLKYLDECKKMRSLNQNANSLLNSYSDVFPELLSLQQKISSQEDLLEELIGASPNSIGDNKKDYKEGKLPRLLARIERSWISFSAIGAKRQGKGHFLSTLMGLYPDNDIFLARNGDPCTATVVTLHQGANRTPVYDKDGKFVRWEVLDQNKAIVKFHTLNSIIAIINQYLEKTGVGDMLAKKGKKDCFYKDMPLPLFLSTCNSIINDVESFTSKDPHYDLSLKLLLEYYIKGAPVYTQYFKKTNETFDVEDIKCSDEKVDYVNSKLRKFISYYHRNDDQIHYDVLAVERVDIYTNFKIGGIDSDYFVIGDTAGIGEAKLNLIETLQNLLKTDVDIAFAVSEFPDKNSGDKQLDATIRDFHLAIRNCFTHLPHQLYYIINVRSSYREEKAADIQTFRENVIKDLRDNEVGIPAVGNKKPGSSDNCYTHAEVKKWEEEHVVILNCDDKNEIYKYLNTIVFPQLIGSIPEVDEMLLNEIDSSIKTLKTVHSEIIESLKNILKNNPANGYGYTLTMQENIEKQILRPMGQNLDNILMDLGSISTIPDNSKEIKFTYTQDEKQQNVIIECIELLRDFGKDIRKFYCEPDFYTCDKDVNFCASDIEKKTPELLSTRDEEECEKLKLNVVDSWKKDKSIRKDAHSKYMQWHNNKCSELIDKEIRMAIQTKLLQVIDTPEGDEIKILAEYRTKLVDSLKQKTDKVLSEKAELAYTKMVNLVWDLLCEKGKFVDILPESEKAKESTSREKVLNAVQGKENINSCLEDNLSEDIYISNGNLRKEMKKALLQARIQGLKYEPDASDILGMLSSAFCLHLVSIESDYKLLIGLRFKEAQLWVDFKKAISAAIGNINQILLPQVIDDKTKQNAKKELIQIYLDNYDKVVDDPKYNLQAKKNEGIERINTLLMNQ